MWLKELHESVLDLVLRSHQKSSLFLQQFGTGRVLLTLVSTTKSFTLRSLTLRSWVRAQVGVVLLLNPQKTHKKPNITSDTPCAQARVGDHCQDVQRLEVLTTWKNMSTKALISWDFMRFHVDMKLWQVLSLTAPFCVGLERVGWGTFKEAKDNWIFSWFNSMSASYHTILVRHLCINVLCTVGSKALSNHVSQTLDTYASHLNPSPPNCDGRRWCEKRHPQKSQIVSL